MTPTIRTVLLLLVLGASSLLLLVPCWHLSRIDDRAASVDKYRNHAHPSRECADGQCLAGPNQSAPSIHSADVRPIADQMYIKETVFGGLDGLFTMVAVMLSGIGADLSTRRIFAMGISNLVAVAFSKGFGEYVASSNEHEFAMQQQAEEYREVRTDPQSEINEMVGTYRKRGLSPDDALAVAKIFSQYEDYWVEHMLWEELGVKATSEMKSPAFSGAVVFMSFIGFGMIPLLGVSFPVVLERRYGRDWFRPQYSSLVALAISAMILFLMGAILVVISGGDSKVSGGAMMLLNGCGCAGLSFSVSQFISLLRPTQTSGTSKSAAKASTQREADESTTPGGSSRDQERRPSVPKSETSGTDLSLPASDSTKSVGSPGGSSWPLFRFMFLRSLLVLWLVVSGLVLVHQFMGRMVYESFRVFGYGSLTCVATAFGVIPLALVRHDELTETWLATANAVAAGMMLAASAGMVQEAHESAGPYDWQILFGLAIGVLFIKGSKTILGDDDDAGMEALCGALMERRHFKRAVLIFTVMFCHSAAEGVAVGVSFDRHCEAYFGLYMSALLAIQNVPEGTAVALVLVPRGVSLGLASLIATLTSVPQPLMAVAAFRSVETFESLLPIGLAFAAGAMVYVGIFDLLVEASEALERSFVLSITGVSFGAMMIVQVLLHQGAVSGITA